LLYGFDKYENRNSLGIIMPGGYQVLINNDRPEAGTNIQSPGFFYVRNAA
jgi:hypothetical protein